MRTAHYIFSLVFICIGWINWRLLSYWCCCKFPRSVRYTYWALTVVSCLTIAYSWSTYPFPPSFYHWVPPLGYIAFAWMSGHFLLLLTFPLLFAARRILGWVNKCTKRSLPSECSLSRRTFLQQSVSAVPLLAFGISGKGVYSAAADLNIRHINLSFPELPADLKGFKIAQICDTHLGPYFSLNKLDQVIKLIKQQAPDILVITGDFIDDLDLLTPSIAKLNELSLGIPYGTYFCWGNHEYFRNKNRIRSELITSHVTLLENSNKTIVVNNTPISILGVDFPWFKKAEDRPSIRQQFLVAASENVPIDKFRILLAHHPDFLSEGFKANIPLTLAGHTHGGQITIGDTAVLPTGTNYVYGLYQQQQSYGYVSAGTGQWFPVRIGRPPEIVIFTLT